MMDFYSLCVCVCVLKTRIGSLAHDGQAKFTWYFYFLFVT